MLFISIGNMVVFGVVAATMEKIMELDGRIKKALHKCGAL